MAIVYTTAPSNYDYDYVVEMETFEVPTPSGKPQVWRKVDINASDYFVRYQCGGYQSGFHAVRDTDPRADNF